MRAREHIGIFFWERLGLVMIIFCELFLERLGLVMIIFWVVFEREKKARLRVKKRGVLERYTSITYFLYFLGKNREKVSSRE